MKVFFLNIHQVMGTLLEAGEAASKFSAFQMGIQVSIFKEMLISVTFSLCFLLLSGSGKCLMSGRRNFLNGIICMA